MDNNNGLHGLEALMGPEWRLSASIFSWSGRDEGSRQLRVCWRIKTSLAAEDREGEGGVLGRIDFLILVFQVNSGCLVLTLVLPACSCATKAQTPLSPSLLFLRGDEAPPAQRSASFYS